MKPAVRGGRNESVRRVSPALFLECQGRQAAARRAYASGYARAVRRAATHIRSWKASTGADRAGPTAIAHSLGAAGSRQDDPRTAGLQRHKVRIRAV